MNSNALAKQYNKLKPRERFALILAASARDDVQERERLVRSAPKCSYQVTDYIGVSMAFHEVSQLHYMELLEVAANYFLSMGLADPAGTDAQQRQFDAAMFIGYLFKVKLEGWRDFCRQHSFEAELLWSILPGYATVQMAEDRANELAFVEEGAQRYLEERMGRTNCRPPTAEYVAAELNAVFRARGMVGMRKQTLALASIRFEHFPRSGGSAHRSCVRINSTKPAGSGAIVETLAADNQTGSRPYAVTTRADRP